MCASDARAICIRGNTWLRIRYFPPRTTERTRGVGAGAYYHPMGKRGAQDPIAENHLGPYWTPSSTRRPAKSPNLAVPAESPGVPKPAKRGRAPARLPPAPPERVRREKPPPPPVTIVQHIYLGADPAHPQQIPPARRENLLGSRATPSKWHHGPSSKMLLAAEAGCGANPKLLSGEPSSRMGRRIIPVRHRLCCSLSTLALHARPRS